MARQNNIRWSKSDKIKLSNAVRNFNSKITRLLKKNPNLKDFLPARKNVNEIKNSIVSRKDFNTEMNSLKRFMKKGAEQPIISKQGIHTTKYEKKEIDLKIKRINREREKKRKDANVSTEKGTMGTINNNNLNPKKFKFDEIKANDWNKFKTNVEKMTMGNYEKDKIEQYRINFETALRNRFVNEDLINKILSLASKISDDKFASLQFDNPVLSIDFIYDPLDEATILENLEIEFLEYLNENKIK